jgi:hypothetical protein
MRFTGAIVPILPERTARNNLRRPLASSSMRTAYSLSRSVSLRDRN